LEFLLWLSIQDKIEESLKTVKSEAETTGIYISGLRNSYP